MISLAPRRDCPKIGDGEDRTTECEVLPVFLVQDVERRKIARELHDSVGQGTTGLKLSLGQLQAAKSPESSDDPALLLETIDLTDRAIGKVRTISALTPPSSA